MGFKPRWDQKLAKALYLRGVPVTEVAKAANVNVGTLRTTIVRKGWSKAKQLAKVNDDSIEPVDSATLAPWLDAKARAWIVETVELLNKITGRASRADLPEGWKGIREVVQVLKELIPAGRALYGLDQKQVLESKLLAPTLQVGITLVNQAPSQAQAAQADIHSPAYPDSEPSKASIIDVDSQALSSVEVGSSVLTVNQDAAQETDPLPEADAASAAGGDPLSTAS